MAQVFTAIQETKNNYSMVMNEFQTNLKELYEEREGCEWNSLNQEEISNLSQTEYFNSLIKELEYDKYFNMSYWLIDFINKNK
jgi:hypothetical protein